MSEWLRWSEQQLARFDELGRAVVLGRSDWPAVATHFPARSAAACRIQYHYQLRRKHEVKAAAVRATKLTARLAAKAAARRAQRAAELVCHQTLTGLICGDPLPGRSALDRKLAAPPRPGITLPAGLPT